MLQIHIGQIATPTQKADPDFAEVADPGGRSNARGASPSFQDVLREHDSDAGDAKIEELDTGEETINEAAELEQLSNGSWITEPDTALLSAIGSGPDRELPQKVTPSVPIDVTVAQYGPVPDKRTAVKEVPAATISERHADSTQGVIATVQEDAHLDLTPLLPQADPAVVTPAQAQILSASVTSTGLPGPELDRHADYNGGSRPNLHDPEIPIANLTTLINSPAPQNQPDQQDLSIGPIRSVNAPVSVQKITAIPSHGSGPIQPIQLVTAGLQNPSVTAPKPDRPSAEITGAGVLPQATQKQQNAVPIGTYSLPMKLSETGAKGSEPPSTAPRQARQSMTAAQSAPRVEKATAEVATARISPPPMQHNKEMSIPLSTQGVRPGAPSLDQQVHILDVNPLSETRSLSEEFGPQRVRNGLQLTQADLPRHVSQQLAEVLQRNGSRLVDVHLNPAELGRVKINVQTGDGTVVLHISADRPETTELLRRHLDLLAEDFREIGFSSATFSFAGNDPETGSDTTRDDTGPVKSGLVSQIADPDDEALAAPLASLHVTDRVDIRI